MWVVAGSPGRTPLAPRDHHPVDGCSDDGATRTSSSTRSSLTLLSAVNSVRIARSKSKTSTASWSGAGRIAHGLCVGFPPGGRSAEREGASRSARAREPPQPTRSSVRDVRRASGISSAPLHSTVADGRRLRSAPPRPPSAFRRGPFDPAVCQATESVLKLAPKGHRAGLLRRFSGVRTADRESERGADSGVDRLDPVGPRPRACPPPYHVESNATHVFGVKRVADVGLQGGTRA